MDDCKSKSSRGFSRAKFFFTIVMEILSAEYISEVAEVLESLFAAAVEEFGVFVTVQSLRL